MKLPALEKGRGVDGQGFDQWLGREERAEEVVTPRHAALLSSVLERPSGRTLPQCGHWLIGVPVVPLSGLGTDGHIKLGGFLPPVPLPRRMWAGSRITFHLPLQVGDAISRHSTVRSLSEKSGSTGRLLFVEVEHEYRRADGALLLSEQQSIVYREAQGAAKAPERDEELLPRAGIKRTLTPDEVMLFRYSAVTFNSHRIHYDLPYARDVEGYAGLVVHGPLIATLLADLVARHKGEDALESYSFRGVSPSFAGEPLDLAGHLDGRTVTLTALGPGGRIVMKAEGLLRRAP